jgi:CBS domain-containing protein
LPRNDFQPAPAVGIQEQSMNKVSDVMTRHPRTLSPSDTVVVAAMAMDELDVGSIPVCQGDQLVGIVTDRDIVVRGLAQGRLPTNIALNDVMTTDVHCCFEDQSIDEVLDQMSDAQIRRVPVLDHERHLVGMLSLGDLAVKTDGVGAGQALEVISEPSEPGHTAPPAGTRGGTGKG